MRRSVCHGVFYRAHGAHDVCAGPMHTQEEWDGIVDRFSKGKFGGVFARLAPKPIVSQLMGDLTSAVIWVDCEF